MAKQTNKKQLKSNIVVRDGQANFCLILHNIRSAYNVGAILRTADAAGVSKMYVCGYTPIPDNPKVQKTALGAEKYVVWEKGGQTWRLVAKLKAEGFLIIALEQTKRSIDYCRLKLPDKPVALVLGNEIKGLSSRIIDSADKIIAIPMSGRKESLNVAVAAGIAIYKIKELLEESISISKN